MAGWWLRVLPPIPEITLSFDNHVVKARVLCETDQNWQGVFLTIGILIAVFDLRLVFPILVVAVDTLENSKKTFTAHLYSVAVLAFEHPAKYALTEGGQHRDGRLRRHVPSHGVFHSC